MLTFGNYDLDRVADAGLEGFGNDVLPEMGRTFGVEISERPRREEEEQQIRHLASVVSIGKMVDAHTSIDDARETAADWVERSGLLLPVDRSFWKPNQPCSASQNTRVIMTGGGATEQDEFVDMLSRRSGFQRGLVWLLTSGRELSDPDDSQNPRVQSLIEQRGSVPTEGSYAHEFTVPRLLDVHYPTDKVSVVHQEGATGQEHLINGLVERSRGFEGGAKTVFVAPPGRVITLAAAYRQAARRLNGLYDAQSGRPQAFMLANGAIPARTVEELEQPGYVDPLLVFDEIPAAATAIMRAAPRL